MARVSGMAFLVCASFGVRLNDEWMSFVFLLFQGSVVEVGSFFCGSI